MSSAVAKKSASPIVEEHIRRKIASLHERLEALSQEFASIEAELAECLGQLEGARDAN